MRVVLNVQTILESNKFRVDEPEKQSGLVAEVPVDQIPIDYENSYKISYSVPCAFCSKNTPHKWGVTAVLRNGDRALCGNCCARRLFGEEVHQRLLSGLKRREETAVKREILGSMIDGIDPVIECIKTDWVTKERLIVNGIGELGRYIPRSFLDNGGDTLSKVPYGEAQGFGTVAGLNALRDRQRYLLGGASRLFEIRQMFGRKLSDIDVKKADGLRRDAIENITKGISFFSAAKRLIGNDDNLVRLGRYIMEDNYDYVQCEIADNGDGNRGFVLVRVIGGNTLFEPHKESGQVDLPPTSIFEQMPNSTELLEPLKT